ncbi:hypothetical protein CLV33_101458 [Jejuia pallidilutea]|uniref:Uncharacterized protein n=1 Tax=Jejuia pallidilutea TaxID=504487 RepID=A0A362X473_9FLAO|nr:hypothetical protein [Jejuia pallidilutea]PQV51534.1 hypothetical protein CLV33_101458 [Jejuia pallidilutea]
MVSHFDIPNHSIEQDAVHLYFEEKKDSPKEEKRRRWLDKTTWQVVQRDWNLVAQGTLMTSEFAAFLKALGQY